MLVTVAHHAGLHLGAAVRAALTPLRANVTLHALDVRPTSGDDIEALSVIAEHGCYALIGRATRDDGGLIKGFHGADPLLADALADHLGAPRASESSPRENRCRGRCSWSIPT